MLEPVSHGRLLAALMAAVAGLALPSAAQAELRWRSCESGHQCARLDVPLDRSGAVSGAVPLRVLRDRGRIAPSGGVTLLLGGEPGVSAIRAYAREGALSGDRFDDLGRADRRNRVVVLDTRGTGDSGALRCRDLEVAGATDAGREAAACAALLGPRRGLYRTAETVQDIEVLRTELGVESLTIVGITYGAYVAQRYALSYPDRVERLVFDSPVDAVGLDPLRLDSFAAARRVLPLLCRRGCASFTQDPLADSSRLATRLAARPLRGQVVGLDGDPRPATLTPQELLFTALLGDRDLLSRSDYPAAVVSALRGDSAPLFRLKHRAVRAARALSPGRFSAATRAAVLCEESPFPWAWQAGAVERDAAATGTGALLSADAVHPFGAGAALRSDLMRLCRRWPTATAAPPADPGPMPDVPVLVLANSVGLGAPLETARRTTERFPQAQLVNSPSLFGTALTFDGPDCASRALERFLAGRSVAPRCAPVAALIAPARPAPTSLARLRPVSGVSGMRGRVLRAFELTFTDLTDDVLAGLLGNPRELDGSERQRGSGLRGGSYDMGDSEGRVDGYEFVPDVRLSLRDISGDENPVMRLDGPGRVDGRLRVVGEFDDRLGYRVKGRLAGRPVRAKLRLNSRFFAALTTGAGQESGSAASIQRVLAGR